MTVEAPRSGERRWLSVLVLAVDTLVLLYGTLLVWIFLGPRIDGESAPVWFAGGAVAAGVIVGLLNVSVIVALVRRRPSDTRLVAAAGSHALLACGIVVAFPTDLGLAGAAVLMAGGAAIWVVARRASPAT